MSSTASAHDVRPKASLPLRGAASASEGFIARAMREPLVHFFVAGFALFVVYALLHPERFAADTSRRIELSVTVYVAARSNEFAYAKYEIESVK
jgi:hypothetical protein